MRTLCFRISIAAACVLLAIIPTRGRSQSWRDYMQLGDRYAATDLNKAIQNYYLCHTLFPADSLKTVEFSDVCSNLAALYTQAGQYQKAIDHYKVCLPIMARYLGKSHSAYLAGLNNLGICYLELNDYAQAEALLQETLTRREKTIGPFHPDYAGTCRNLVQLYQRTRQFSREEPLLVAILAANEKKYGRMDSNYYNATGSLGGFYLEQGQLERADSLFTQLYVQAQQAHFPDGNQHARAAYWLGQVRSSQNRSTEALALWTEAYPLFRDQRPRHSFFFPMTAMNIAVLLANEGNGRQALPLYREAYDAFASAKQPDRSAFFLLCCNYASSATDQGSFTLAGELLTKAEHLAEKNNPEETVFLNSIEGVYYFRTSQYSEAESKHLAALQLAPAVYGTAGRKMAQLYNNMGLFYKGTGQLRRAQSFYHKALQTCAQEAGDSSLIAIILSNLGSLHKDLGNRDSVGYYFSKAGSVLVHNQAPTAASATVLNNMGVSALGAGLNDMAASFFSLSYLIREQLLGSTHPDVATSCVNLATVYERKGSLDSAAYLLTRALSIQQQAIGKENWDYAHTAQMLAELNHYRGRVALADSLYQVAFASRMAQFQKVTRFASQSEQSAFLLNNVGEFGSMLSFYLQNAASLSPARAYDIICQTRSMLLTSQRNLRAAVAATSDPVVLQAYDRWNRYKSTLADQYSQNVASALTAQLEDSAASLEKYLVKMSARFREARKSKSWEEVKATLSPGESAIELVDFDEARGFERSGRHVYAALLIRPDATRPVFVELCSEQALSQLFRKFPAGDLYRGITPGNRMEHDTVLYRLVWKPLERYLANTRNIFIAPSGLTNRIAFAAIPAGKGLLSDKYRISTCGTTAQLQKEQQHTLKQGQAIAVFGGVDYASGGGKNADPWNFLSGTRSEADAIAALANAAGYRVASFGGEQATEVQVKRLSGTHAPAVLHIATHGFFFPKLEGAGNAAYPAREEALRRAPDPMLRAGLVFSGANASWNKTSFSGADDGVLTALEVEQLDFSQTELVVLSACETGLGEIAGSEGVYGLQRAFRLAGARRMLMSLWKVPDVESTEFMTTFYRLLFEGKQADDAFVTTQQKMKAKFPNQPLKWAAWILLQ